MYKQSSSVVSLASAAMTVVLFKALGVMNTICISIQLSLAVSPGLNSFVHLDGAGLHPI